jgi:vancomycin resistance protein VanW
MARSLQDQWTGAAAAMVQPGSTRRGYDWPVQLRERQPIRPGALTENKVHNLGLAIAAMQDLAIEPGQLLSFWRLVGPPTLRAGFREGRALAGGRLSTSVGGGLCQLSGAIYSLALRAGLQIAERHAHSIDIYDEQSRYTPLGADATVSYPSLDLRVGNTLAQPLCLRFELRPDELLACLCAPGPIAELKVEHVALRRGERVEVRTLRRGEGGGLEDLGRSLYGRPGG